MSTLPPSIWCTDTVPVKEQFSFWREAVCEAFLHLDVSCTSPDQFHGTIDSREFGKLRLNRVDAQQQHVKLNARGLARTGKECFYINFQAAGRSMIKQRDREAQIASGQWYILDSTEPFELRYDDCFLSYNFEVPYKALGSSITALQKSTGHTLGMRNGLESYLMDYASGVSKHVDQFDIVRKEKLCADFIEMLVSSLTEPPPWASLSGPVRVRREIIERYIEDNIENPLLSPALIVNACNISLSTLYSIFNAEEQPVMRYIRAKRLELAYKRLQSFVCRDFSISEIAYSCGFSDLSHFCHGFKDRFGQSPRVVRSQVLKKSDESERQSIHGLVPH
jgi:AraC family transcriptional regulator, positive regulator of tynA and feaB